MTPASVVDGIVTGAGAGIETTVCLSVCSSWPIDEMRTFVSSAFSRRILVASATPSMTSF